MFRRPLMFALMVSTGCAHPAPPPLPAPNPNGCYVIVYEREQFRGARELLNGPARLTTLRQLSETNEPNWENRIRSLRVGTTAIVTVYVEPAFKGQSQRVGPETQHARLGESFSARIRSLELACAAEKDLP
jgi:hypothetical protein